MAKDKKIIYIQIDVDMDKKTYRKLANLGLNLIVNDEDELVNYAANHLLREEIKKMRKSCTR